jgi:glycosyltransferase involved in cell wall biosynthesis
VDKGFPTVCIDCSPLLVRSAGVKTYVYHWLKALQARRPDAIRTFLAPDGLKQLIHEGGLKMYPRQILTLLSLNRLPGFVTGMVAPKCDIFHTSNLLRNFPATARLSATLHDLTPWILPECHTPRMVSADKMFASRTLSGAAGVIAVSESTKRDAVRILGLSPDKIHVIHLGISDRYFSVSQESVLSAIGSLKLPRPYFLSVGTIEPRKNLDALLAAWETLPDTFRAEYELVIAGMPGWRSEATMNRIRLASRDYGVRYLGYVPEDVLPGLTAGAAALLYPSLYEGFGIPVAQAMAAGCPVITSNVSSLPEITGGAALLVDPRSVNEIAGAIRTMGDSEELRTTLRAAGLTQAERFTWERAAEASFRYFEAIC